MDKNEQLIMVVPREKLFGSAHFEGFRPADVTDYQQRILDHFQYMRRGDAEVDPMFKQPIGYVLVVNRRLKKVFAYQRAVKDAHYHEKRLQGKWSWGVGGHIDQEDGEHENPLQDSVLRELQEEVHIPGSARLHVLGYINHETDAVGQVHFGVLYVAETDAENVSPKDTEMQHGQLRALDELKQLCDTPECSVEEWSRIALEPLKDYLATS